MQWRTPLSTVLVAIVLVSCDQQPIEPVDEAPAAETASLNNANPATIISGTIDEAFDLCGTEVWVEGWYRFPFRFDFDPTGEKKSHYIDNTTFHMWAESASGDRWRANESYNEQSQWFEGSAPDVWSVHWRTHWIGLGQAPDFYGEYWFRYTVNANGEVVTFWEFEDPFCPTS